MIILCILLLSIGNTAWANDGQSPILAAAERHARQLAAGQPGEIRIEAGPIDSSRRLPCTKMETYTPPNTRGLGRIHIGVRCEEGGNWNILVPVRISVITEYVVTRRALLAGKNVQAADIHLATGDLGTLPTGSILSPEQAVGKVLRNSVGAGQPLRANQLSAVPVIRQGQSIKIISRGPGFAIKAEGKALNSAAPGELARARMPSGKTISGIAQQDGSILLAN